jgi:hypothetical protein
MFKSNFAYLKRKWPSLADLGELAERNLYSDPHTSLIKLRVLCETLTKYVFAHEKIADTVKDLNSRLLVLKNNNILDNDTFHSLNNIRKLGNLAAHNNHKSQVDASESLKCAFNVCSWFTKNYSDIEIEPNTFVVPNPRIAQDKQNGEDIKKLLIELETDEKADNEQLEQLVKDDNIKIGQMVQASFEYLAENNLLSDKTIVLLQNPSFSKALFNINYPCISMTDNTLPTAIQRNINGYPRYYKRTYEFNGKVYFLCNDWYERNREPFIIWLKGFNLDIDLDSITIRTSNSNSGKPHFTSSRSNYQYIENQYERDKVNKVAYYLSRFDHENLLPNSNSTGAINIISDILKVKANTLRNKRDSFDPYCNELKTTGTKRKGWWQKTLSEDMQRIFDEYKNKSVYEIETEVKRILD